MAKSFVAKNGIIGAAALIGITGCNSLGNLVEPNKVDYKSAGKVSTVSLEVPPDLTQIRRDSRFAVPDANKSSATASGYNLEKGNKTVSAAQTIAPVQIKDMRIVRDGSERWLVVHQSPEVLWPQIKEFWQDYGFLINVENQETGIIETDWAENRAKIPQDIIRNTLGKVLDSLYSTGERDKFRTRIERGQNGDIEIFISHRGAQEVVTGGAQKDGTIWTPRPNDPGLEAEFLSRLMVRLGADTETAKAAVVAADAAAKPHAKLLKTDKDTYVEVDEGSQGVYFVRYVDQDIDAKGKQEGFFSKLFSFGSSDAAKNAQKYRIYIKNAGSNGEVSHITVHDSDGKIDSSPTATKILQLLNDQLK